MVSQDKQKMRERTVQAYPIISLRDVTGDHDIIFTDKYNKMWIIFTSEMANGPTRPAQLSPAAGQALSGVGQAN